jgi:hypothetical protein
MSAAPASSARRSGGLTSRGLAVAYTYRLRQAVETLPPAEAAELLAELRELVSAYCLQSPRPAA